MTNLFKEAIFSVFEKRSSVWVAENPNISIPTSKTTDENLLIIKGTSVYFRGLCWIGVNPESYFRYHLLEEVENKNISDLNRYTLILFLLGVEINSSDFIEVATSKVAKNLTFKFNPHIFIKSPRTERVCDAFLNLNGMIRIVLNFIWMGNFHPELVKSSWDLFKIKTRNFTSLYSALTKIREDRNFSTEEQMLASAYLILHALDVSIDQTMSPQVLHEKIVKELDGMLFCKNLIESNLWKSVKTCCLKDSENFNLGNKIVRAYFGSASTEDQSGKFIVKNEYDSGITEPMQKYSKTLPLFVPRHPQEVLDLSLNLSEAFKEQADLKIVRQKERKPSLRGKVDLSFFPWDINSPDDMLNWFHRAGFDTRNISPKMDEKQQTPEEKDFKFILKEKTGRSVPLEIISNFLSKVCEGYDSFNKNQELEIFGKGVDSATEKDFANIWMGSVKHSPLQKKILEAIAKNEKSTPSLKPDQQTQAVEEEIFSFLNNLFSPPKTDTEKKEDNSPIPKEPITSEAVGVKVDPHLIMGASKQQQEIPASPKDNEVFIFDPTREVVNAGGFKLACGFQIALNLNAKKVTRKQVKEIYQITEEELEALATGNFNIFSLEELENFFNKLKDFN